jgi:hypothetical protein
MRDFAAVGRFLVAGLAIVESPLIAHRDTVRADSALAFVRSRAFLVLGVVSVTPLVVIHGDTSLLARKCLVITVACVRRHHMSRIAYQARRARLYRNRKRRSM